MTEWTETTLGELCKFQAGDAFPKDQQGVSMGEYPFIKVSDMNLPGNERFIQRSNNWIRKADASKYRLHPPGAVVFAKIGEALRANRRRVLVRETIIDNNMMSAAPKGGINPAFLLYLLEGIDFNDISRGSALPYLAAGDLNKLSVTIPKPEAQSAIANTLSLLDRKIELNRRMNETLEGMAQAIFRDWFVDFGPTRRKAAGETDPVAIMGGLTPDAARAAELSVLFPAAFGDDGLPVGWSNQSIYAVASVIYGAPFASKRFNSDGIGRPLVRIRDLPRHGSELFTDEVHSREYVIQPGNIVVGMDGEFRARVWQGIPSLMNQRVCCFQAKSSDARAFVYFSIKPTLDQMEKSAVGTTVIHLGKGDIDRFTTIDPGEELITAFGEIAEVMLDRLTANGLESRTLAETRDYLLPRLMSGAVRVAPKVEAA